MHQTSAGRRKASGGSRRAERILCADGEQRGLRGRGAGSIGSSRRVETDRKLYRQRRYQTCGGIRRAEGRFVRPGGGISERRQTRGGVRRAVSHAAPWKDSRHF